MHDSDTKAAGLKHRPSSGLTFLVRARGGITSLPAARTTVPVLVESSYGHSEDLSDYSTLVCIAGCVGITAVIPHLHRHPGYSNSSGASETVE